MTTTLPQSASSCLKEPRSEVREQYEAYPFPPVKPCDEQNRLVVTPQDTLSKISHYCFQGKEDFQNNARVLVAGGGTGHAVIFLAEQLRHTNAEVVYLDLSEASMATAQERAKLRGLTNITWNRGSILDIPTLDLGKFDYINCTGVLHHLENPRAGLKSLARILKPGGAMGLMLYGKYGRTGVYQIQELMREINGNGLDQATKVENTKTVLESLPPSHWQMRGRDRERFLGMHLQDDHDLYDLFLHSQDCAYSVPEVYDYVEEAGLRLNGFTHFHSDPCELIKYNPRTYVKDQKLLEQIRSLPKRKQLSIAELLGTDISLHTFYVSFREDAEASVEDLDNVPFLLHATHGDAPIFSSSPLNEYSQWMLENPGKPLIVRNPVAPSIALAPTVHLPLILKHLDGNNSVSDIIFRVRQDVSMTGEIPHPETVLQEFKRVYHALHSIGWMFLKQKTITN